MAGKKFERGKPKGDATRHLSMIELESAHAKCSSPRRDEGRLSLIVRRLEDGRRESLAKTNLNRDAGLPGDDWSRRPARDPDAQLAVMNTAIAALIANGQPLTTFGDNLFVDLDLSAENLPSGTRIAVGGALVVVTPKPHDGCIEFDARFGNGALRFVQARATRDQNRRGIYWRVDEAGEVAVGDLVRVLSRGAG